MFFKFSSNSRESKRLCRILPLLILFVGLTLLSGFWHVQEAWAANPWIQATASAAWSARYYATSVVFDSKMWVMGGYGNSNLNDVWSSTDGITWAPATASANWSARYGATSVVFDSKMWVMGGADDVSVSLHDVWYSTDGITWTRATAAANWPARNYATSVVFDSKMWVMGGTDDTGTSFNDVWSSTDGITWTQATAAAAWSARSSATSVVFDSKMWVMGGSDRSGTLNDVWYSTIVNATPPAGPTNVSSPSHTISTWSNDNTIDVSWTAATSGVGISGYSYVFDHIADTVPAEVQNLGAVTTVTSPALIDGKANYFHIQAVDTIGAWGDPVHLGPFYVDTTAPTVPGSPSVAIPSNKPTWSWTASADSTSTLPVENWVWGAWTAKFHTVGTRGWLALAMSSDGKFQTAGDLQNGLYVSDDYGNTWATTSGGPASALGLAMSSDGQIQTAVASAIFVSTDYGNTWTSKGYPGYYWSVAMSSDGKFQTAGDFGGYLYVSTDYGNTWTTKDSARQWDGIAMSSDGKFQTAVDYSGYPYVSTDYGNTWAPKGSITSTWHKGAMSSDGKIQVMAHEGGYLYVSTDYGNTWALNSAGPSDSMSIAMSSDGKIQTSVSLGGYLYVSTDYGNTWALKTTTGSKAFWTVAMSSDGGIQTAGGEDESNITGGYLYVSYADTSIPSGYVSSGLASTPYTIQWSTDPTFASGVSSSTATTNSFTHSSSLADGTWYFRVKATDNTNNTSSYSTNGSVVVGATASTTSSSSSDSNSTSSCDVQSPSGFPNLFLIDISSNKATLYFSPSGSPYDRFYVSYGTSQSAEGYGVEVIQGQSTGALSYSVNFLSPDTKYFFKVRGGNGCKPGSWSNILEARTKPLIAFNQLEFVSSNLEPVTDKTSNKSCQTYTVVFGDTLWSIAVNKLGDGNKYKDIVNQNKQIYTSLGSSNNLKVGWELKLNCGNSSQETIETTQNLPPPEGYKVKVKVTDTSKKPVEGAKVTIHSKVQEATTNKDGIATFSNVEAGEHKVLIAYNNFQGEQSVNLTGNVKEFNLNVSVKQKAISLSPLAYGIIGIMGLIIVVLIVLLSKARRKV